MNGSAATLRFSIAIMAKAPIAGYAKTRLIPLLGAAGAARAQRGFILRTLATAIAAAPQSITLWCAPDPTQRFFRALRQHATVPRLAWRRQHDGDLGQRMADTFTGHAQARAAPLLLVGTDCPALSPDHLREAARVLCAGAGADAVLGPVEDGGYVLVGLRNPSAAPLPPIFDADVQWGTARVLAQTRERLGGAGLRWHELPLLWDVDEPADWLRWQALRSTADRMRLD